MPHASVRTAADPAVGAGSGRRRRPAAGRASPLLARVQTYSDGRVGLRWRIRRSRRRRARAVRADGVDRRADRHRVRTCGIARSSAAAEQLYALKGRPESMPIAVLVDRTAQAAVLADVSAEAQRLMDAFWPGPLTIVLDRRGGVARWACAVLTTRSSTRWRSGSGPCRSRVPTVTARPRRRPGRGRRRPRRRGRPDRGRGTCPGTASTVVDGTDATLPVLREGPIHREQIVAAALR